MTNEEALAQAEYRWLHDPEFHARVTFAVQAIDQDLWQKTGHRLDPSDRSLATHAACLGVIAAELPITNDIVNAMAQIARKPWFIQRPTIEALPEGRDSAMTKETE